jgi:DNA-binding LacI/PurR family transcriptional regulator
MSIVTQSDIAKRLGVDQKTVSIAFGANGRINPATRARVLRVAKQLGYQPNRLAAALRGAATQSVGVIWPFVDPWAGDAVIGLDILRRIQAKGFATYQAQMSEDVEVTLRQIDDFLSRRVDAIVIHGIPSLLSHPEVIDRLGRCAAVVAVTREPIDDFPGDLVIHDRYSAIRQVVDHFAKTGRKRPAMPVEMAQESNPPKFHVFQDQCRKHGIADHPHLLISMDYPERPDEHGNLHLAGFRRQFPETVEVDAVFCFNDIGALYIMRELQDRGLRVPEDVAVVGFNNSEAGRLWRPALASGDRKFRVTADSVFQMLEQRLEDPERPPVRNTVNMEFIWRDSAG